MAISGDDFPIKGVPAHAMVVKPCRTSSQVSLDCYPPYKSQTSRQSPIRPTVVEGRRCVFFELHM